MINYDWVTPETQKDFDQVLRKHGLAFLAWRAKHPVRKAQNLAQAYKVWWVTKGPVGFATNEDVVRFRQELFRYIEQTLSEVSPAVDV